MQSSEQRDITLAVGHIGERVDERSAVCLATSRGGVLLIGNTLDEELCAVLVEEFGSLRDYHVRIRIRSWQSESYGSAGPEESTRSVFVLRAHLHNNGIYGSSLAEQEQGGGEDRLGEAHIDGARCCRAHPNITMNEGKKDGGFTGVVTANEE